MGVRHAGWLHDRYHVRQDSHLTAYHARRGKPYDGQITKFGASVLYMMPAKKSDKPKRLEHHWSYGVWVGKTEDSQEHIVLTSDGARIARTVRVLDEVVAKEKVMWLHVCGVPYHPRKASHPDGKKMRKVQPVPILLPQAVQPDSENQTSEHHEDGVADQPTNEDPEPEMPEDNRHERKKQEMIIPSEHLDICGKPNPGFPSAGTTPIISAATLLFFSALKRMMCQSQRPSDCPVTPR